MNNTFLIVDDCIINRLVIKIILQKNNHDVTEASDGSIVVDLIKEGNVYEIIWIDLQMPVIDGIECTKILRDTLGYDGVIIGITAHADYETFDACLKCGMNDVMPKPITEEKILEIIKKYRKDRDGHGYNHNHNYSHNYNYSRNHNHNHTRNHNQSLNYNELRN